MVGLRKINEGVSSSLEFLSRHFLQVMVKINGREVFIHLIQTLEAGEYRKPPEVPRHKSYANQRKYYYHRNKNYRKLHLQTSAYSIENCCKEEASSFRTTMNT